MGEEGGEERKGSVEREEREGGEEREERGGKRGEGWASRIGKGRRTICL